MKHAQTSHPGALLSAILLTIGLAAGAIAAFAQPAPPAVLVATAELRDVAGTAEFVGRIKAVDKVDLRARVTGYLGPRRFKEGDQVKADQTIFTLDPAPFEATLAQRKAEVAAAKATLDLATVQAQRGRELIKTKTIPQSELDQREATLLKAQASLQQAQAAQQAAEVDLSYTQIKSPIDGRIGQAAYSPGNLVGPDSGVLATVVKQDPIQVVFNVSQRQLLEARRDVPQEQLNAIVARLRLADGSTYDQSGKLDFIGVQADPNTDSIPLRAVFPNPKDLLSDGMSVRVVIEAGKPAQALVIPQSAVAQDQAGTYVFVVDAANKAIMRKVKIEMQRDGTAIVKDGLAAGDRVIVQGQARVRPGMTVAPSAAPPA
ncbi:MAG: efflux RND transporter periplasmic adaptor subunit [Alphaproteobacteria bacterium]|nr:efflux RND transporter periplasmic adaptor subunit [Alphaproteobacteria bacterium]